ncbi:MAG: T9SS type A sorting domain-containing protein [Ignavibacteria bacterium]|nr:T9SS type A sorting domain-containing protein [Ignavibacteria bacterium]
MKKILILILILIAKTTLSQTPVYYNNYPITVDDNRKRFQKAGIPLITDIDRNGQKEIIFVVLDYEGIANPPLYLYVLNNDGTNFANFPKGYNELIHDVASGDVNGDGFLEIVLRMAFSFDVIDRFGNSLPGFPVNYSDGDVFPTKFISLYDLDNDGKLEIIVSKNNNVSIFNHDGSIRNGWPRYIPGRANYNPAIGDINGDGYGELIFTSFKLVNQFVDSGAVHIFKHDGEIYSNNFPIFFDSLYFSWSSSPSLFIHPNDPSLSFFNVVLDKFNTQGFELHKFLKLDFQGNKLFTEYYSAYMDYGTLVMGDANRNGDLEFATGTQYGSTFSAFDKSLNQVIGWPNYGQGEHWATGMIGKLTFGNNLNVVTNTWHTFNPNGYGYIYAYTPEGVNLPWSPLRPEGLVNGVSFADLNNDGSVELIATSTRTGNETFLHVWTIPGIPFTNEDFPWPQYGHDRYRTNQYGFIPPDEPVGIQPMNSNVPASFNLYQNFPNPFNPATSIKFDIAKKGNVRLVVFDILGRELSTLINESLNPGTYQVSFDGSGLSSGIYFCRLQSENYITTLKMNLIK